MINTAFSPWPSYAEDEVRAATAVLTSGRVNYWTGEEGRHFEREFAAACGVEYAVALSNGTVALDLALKVLGIGPGDDVVVTSRTFLASASCIVNAGARPVFADVDGDSQNIGPATILAALTPNTKALLCVHLAGWPCDMDAIMKLARDRKLLVVEDCAQAVGARLGGRSVGSFGDVAAWSFCQDKIITTAGEGGMLTTNDRRLWNLAWSYKDHGKSWDAVYKRSHPIGFRWLHDSFGTNWRMTEIQAAIGRIQLRKLPEWRNTRKKNAESILSAAGKSGIFRVPLVPSHVEHAWYKAYAFVNSQQLGTEWDRDRVVAEINSRGVPCAMGTCSEVYLEKAFEGTDLRPARRLPVARELGDSSVMFMVHPTLTSREIEKTCSVIEEVGALARRTRTADVA